MSGRCEPPVLLCGARAHVPHKPHEWRWRTAVIPPDLTGETTPYRWCPGVSLSVPSSEGEQE
jgi:hypothetical protein